ncbi:M48 family metallopeptidase [Pedosphaera parvula]|uniref:Peptidase M48 Ste24p n=1 Tax=Pedosphaera parvula (strain Ellin514) TaxID=320771 RepID=B9XPY8_PEDPL|nr:M48 family metallopeptidase [Pedosphaera parvula]EEF58085.1 peptidase M48 Ste24p [Pedosphaera parvula Ellin514]
MDEEIVDTTGELAGTGVSADSPLNSIEGELLPSRVSFMYQLGLIVVAAAMILLPLSYVCLVGLFGFCVYYYATHFSFLLTHYHGFRIFIFQVLIYIGPIFSGAVLTFFFIKPIFRRHSTEEKSYSLNVTDAPHLFALIGWICRALNAPIPSRVDVDCSPNASAGFRGGWRSLFGNDIILTIGLPLVSGMTQSQLAGVIAHEYGHFSQGVAMRAQFIIVSINAWFYKVVYERDHWDTSLVAMSEDEGQDGRLMILLYLARFCVWIGRRILWIFMVLGHLLSSFLSRQMEFDADQYQMKMSGSETFVATFRRLRQIVVGTQIAHKQMGLKWKQERKLLDRMPEFITSRADEIPADTQDQVYLQALQQKTCWYDSHPSHALRIQRALRAGERGVFHRTEPASELFSNFAELSQRVTVFFYQDLLGPQFTPDLLVSTEAVTRRGEHDYTADQQNIKRFFHGVATSLRPIIISEHKALVFRSREHLITSIQQNRQRMHDILPAAVTAYNSLKDADDRLIRSLQALHLLDGGCTFNPEDFGVAGQEIKKAVEVAQEEFDTAVNAFKPFEEAGRLRINDAIQLLRLPQIAASIPEGTQLQDESRQMIWTLSRLGETFGQVLELRKDCATLEVLLHYRQEQANAGTLEAEIEVLSIGIQESINQLQTKLSQVRYPFSHTTENVFVSDYARNKDYHSVPSQLLLREGTSHVEKLIGLYQRLLSNLIAICETVEKNAVDKTVA